MTEKSGVSLNEARVVFVAGGHDVAGSTLTARWRTPSGKLLVEGRSYEKAWIVKSRLVRIDHDGTETYREKGGWEVVSEALDAPPEPPVGASGEHTPRGQA